ncbi:pyruvate dehydrogenase (acetyl-transferring) E1 component subunit alpha [Persicobacter psychrovividus]|uniref:Pyruvate dehydrogenase E1 component subunit alpha n=1 Tax=Persicobacter psychrovividus TaxID=387638 RepID=A0ABN6L4D8_9BACT|nr:pyruvate dehydrogenase E1 component subunit alpha [Persicobacter psychrovividus]
MSNQSVKAGDKATEGRFSKETYMWWYEKMLYMRRFEEMSGRVYGQQKIAGFCHLYIGQEACAAGAVSALKEGDKYITAYRDHAHPIALGSDPKRIMAEMYGKATGLSKGKGGSMHIFDVEKGFYGGHGIVGGQIPLGTGLAFAEKYKGTDNLCIAYMGDGAARQGAVHEAFNMAMTAKLPIIFVIENNGYAMGTSVQRTSNVVELYKLGESYDMPSRPVDGMSVEEVHIAVEEAAEHIRAGKGPVLLEMRTYRYKGHSMSDPAKYRTKEEVESYKQKDPVQQIKATLLEKGYATEEELKALDKEIKEEVKECVKFAEESPYPDPKEIYTDVYSQEDYPFVRE